MGTISLKHANEVVEGALQCARGRDAAPMTVAVLDAGGHLTALQREDNSSLLRPQIAVGKAWGALGVGAPSAMIEKMAEVRPQLVQALSVLSGGQIVPAAGGVLIRNGAGELLGAVGVSGDTSEVDQDCAVAGVEGAGLIAVAGPPS